MKDLLLVGMGGFAGSVARYLMSGWVQGSAGGFPAGTLAVNVLGCFVIGGFSELAESRSLFVPSTRVFVMVGLLGGFTTFSAFGNETMNLLREGERLKATLNVAAHVVLAIGAVWAGRAAVHALWR